MEAADGVDLTPTQEDRLDQGGEFMQTECTSDQTSTGYSVEVEEEEGIGGQLVFRKRSAKAG